MDVERIQKINALALDLMRQGLASDREDATIQAERIYRSRDIDGYSSFKETMNKVQGEHLVAPATAVQAPAAESLSEPMIKEILEKNTQFIVKTLKDFQDRLQSVEKEFSSLRSQFASVQRQSFSDSSTASSARPAAASSGNSTAPQPHPRSGNYSNADVSIEKFFYAGSK